MFLGQAGAVARATLCLLAAGSLLAACTGPRPQVAVASPPPPAPTVTWPTHGWPRSAPEAQGIDSNVLADAMATIKARHIPVHSLLIERHGTIVLDAYFYPFADNQLHDVYSITKSVVSSLVGIAVSKEEVRDLNTPVLALLPQPATAETIDTRKARLTLAHLLSMTSGLDCGSEGGENFLQQMEHSAHWTTFALDRREIADPGSAFEYCAGNMHLVSAVLSRTTGTSASAFAQSELFAPLGIQNAVWPSDGDGVSQGFAGLKLQPRDMAKLGYLWLHHGMWEDSYLQAALSPHANVEPNVQYGYGMWIYPTRGHAGGPADFEANGYSGQRISVIPSQDMVVVITGAGLDANDVAALISGATRSNAPLPANAAGNARLGGLVLAAANTPSDVRFADTLAKAPAPAPQPKPALPNTRS